MTIFYRQKKRTQKDAIGIISEPDGLVRQIVKAWHQSNINHYFKNEKHFKKAVRKNHKTLKSPERIDALFTLENYRFSTKKGDREETLYFEGIVEGNKSTGRLRQQHGSGPLAKIDLIGKQHLFVDEKKYKRLRKFHKEHPKELPIISEGEKEIMPGAYHIEFAVNEKRRVKDWHGSRGIVVTGVPGADNRIKKALKGILGIRQAENPAAALRTQAAL